MPRHRLINTFKFGADPEFVAFDNSRHERNRVYVSNSVFGKVGNDHGLEVLELRPKPSRSTTSLVWNMRGLLALLHLQVSPTQQWYAESIHTPTASVSVGGHIHIDRPRVWLEEEGGWRLRQLRLIRDKLKGYTCSKTSAVIRQAKGYAPDDISIRDQGRRLGPRPPSPFQSRSRYYTRLEFRDLHSWLASPLIAFIHITFVKAAICVPDFIGSTSINLHSLLDRLPLGVDEDFERLRSLGAVTIYQYPSPFQNLRNFWGISPNQYANVLNNIVPPINGAGGLPAAVLTALQERSSNG